MGKIPSIEVISFFYNESFMAPFFLNHYSYADKITVLYDDATTDNTREIISNYPNAQIVPFTFPNLFDDVLKVETIRDYYLHSECDWVIIPDSDEFVFCDDLHEFLSRQVSDIVRVRLYQVYRHANEKDLDPSIPIYLQRRHGDPDVIKGQNSHGTKPIIARRGRRVHWMPGIHSVWNPHRHTFADETLIGAHWCMADPCFSIDRRMRGMYRQGENNKKARMSYHNDFVDPELVRQECEQHRYDKELF